MGMAILSGASPLPTELRSQPRQRVSVTWEAYKPQCQPSPPPWHPNFSAPGWGPDIIIYEKPHV